MISPPTHPDHPPSPAPAPGSPAVGISWPTAVLASVIVIAGLTYHYLLILHGLPPGQATRTLLMTAVPLVALVLPTSSVGAAARTVCRTAAVLLGKIGGGQ